MKRDTTKAKSHSPKHKGRSVAEWTSLIFSIAVILIPLIIISSHYVTEGSKPAYVHVDVDTKNTKKFEDKYYVPVIVRNEGDEVAENLQVTIEQTIGDKSDKNTFQIHFLTGGSKQKAFVILDKDPKEGKLQTNIESYLVP